MGSGIKLRQTTVVPVKGKVKRRKAKGRKEKKKEGKKKWTDVETLAS